VKAALLRVGIDSGSGGSQGPIFRDGSFEFVSIPDSSATDERTYGNTIGRSGRALAEFLPKRLQTRMASQAMHVDPEFETFTYGDPTSPKAGLRRLERGDLLAFYAGLRGWSCDVAPGLFLIGYFVVHLAGYAREMSMATIRDNFSQNFHVRHRSVFESQRDRLVLVKGGVGSRFLYRAVRISSPAESPPGHMVLSKAMRKHFGDLNGKPDITRSPTRWIAPEYALRAREFVLSLE
jgi:Nucleotide modification associated domain 3